MSMIPLFFHRFYRTIFPWSTCQMVYDSMKHGAMFHAAGALRVLNADSPVTSAIDDLPQTQAMARAGIPTAQSCVAIGHVYKGYMDIEHVEIARLEIEGDAGAAEAAMPERLSATPLKCILGQHSSCSLMSTQSMHFIPGTLVMLVGVILLMSSPVFATGGSTTSLSATSVEERGTDTNARPTLSTLSDTTSRKVVATTFTVIQDMARNVAGDLWEVVSITPPNAEIHEYEPSPKDILKARKADLLLWNGLGLERWFERFYTHMDHIPVAVLSRGLTPMPLVKGPYRGEPNPHGWISPANAAIYIDNIQQALSQQDPAHADIYRHNAEAYKARIARLGAPIAQQLARIPARQRRLTTCEGAFSYLARDYEVGELYLWAVNAEQEGTPQQIRSVVDTVRKDHIPVVFCESTVSPRAMKQVAKETNTHFGGVLYVDSLSSQEGPVPTYESLLTHNAHTILEGFNVDDHE